MAIFMDGIEGEELGRQWLRGKGIYNQQQLDWLFKYNGSYYCLEVKNKELFVPPPFYGAGLDIKQINFRKQLYDDLGIKTILLVFERGTNNVYWQLLDKLEEGEYIDTKNKIRVYNINEFKKGTFIPKGSKNG